jgi:flagellar biogenesis protein FliO
MTLDACKYQIRFPFPPPNGVVLGVAGLLLAARRVSAETLDATHSATSPASSLPNVGASIVHVFGAFILVVALFLAGVWLFRNWQRLVTQKNGASKLTLLEVKSLGQRQALYVVGYQEQRMLLASSPAGVALLSHLPPASETEQTAPAANVSFVEAFQQVLSRKS